MTNAEYHAHPAVSKSDLDLLNRSPAHYRYCKDNPKEQTEAMLVGSVAHKLILEPDDFENEYSVMPTVDRRTKAGKAEYQRFADELGSRTPVSQGLFDEVSAMASAVKAHPAVKKLLCGGKAEESFFWDENGIECKCRPDYLKNKIAVDLKTTSDASPAAFEKSAYNYRYHVQAWWYLHGLNKCGIEVTDFIFIAFEKNPPYAVCIYAADDLMLELGEREAMKNLEAYRQSSKTGIWYGYEKDALIHSLSLPDWVVRKEF